MTKDQAWIRLLELIHEMPTMSTAGVMDVWRAEVEASQRAEEESRASMQRGMLAQSEAEYRYALTKPLSSLPTAYGQMNTRVDARRLTEEGLRELSRLEKLDFGKLRDVAIGVRESYKGWHQGEFSRFTYGQPYHRPSEDEPVPVVEKLGAFGLFRRGPQRNDEE